MSARRARISTLIALATIACASAISSTAGATDPYFGSSGVALPTQSPLDPPGRAFREYVQEIHSLLISNSVDRGRYLPAGAVNSVSVKKGKNPSAEAKLPAGLRFFGGLHLRKTGTSDQLVGALGPTDSLFATFPGLLIAGRFGVAEGPFAIYGMMASGGYRTMRVSLPRPGFAGVDVQGAPELAWSGMVMGGVGAEVRFTPRFALGTELDLGSLVTRPSADTMTWPTPGETIRTAVGALRFEY